MSVAGEPQTLAPQLDPPNMAELLRRRVAGEPFPYSFIHEVSAYFAAPEDLVRGRDPAPATDGKAAWYFYSAFKCHQSTGRRNRRVGGGGHTFWHPEGAQKPIQGPDRKSVLAYWRTLSYVEKVKNQSGTAAKLFTNRRLHWCMIEVCLAAGQQWELCKVYRSTSPRSTADPAETSTAAAGAVDVGPAAGMGISGVEEWLQHDSAQEGGAIPEEPLDVTDMTYRSPRADAESSVPGGGMPCPAPCECDTQSMELAMEAAHSYIRGTPAGVVITRTTRKSILTSIELKRNVTILDIESTSTLDQNTFVEKAISIFQLFDYLGISVDCEYTSKDKMSFTLVPSEKMLNQQSIQLVLDKTVEDLQEIATVDRLEDRSVISLTGYSQMSIAIVGRVRNALESNHVAVERFSTGSSEMKKVSLVVHDSVAEHCVHVLRSAFDCKPPPPPPPKPKPCPPLPCPPLPKPKPCVMPPRKLPPPPDPRKNFVRPPMLTVAEHCVQILRSAFEIEIVNGTIVNVWPQPPPMLKPAGVECSADFDFDGEVESGEEEQELTETDESGSELGSATEEMERSHQESTTNHDGRDLGGSSEPGIWEICGWVRRLAIAKPSMPSAGRTNTNSLCSRLAVWLAGFCAKQNSAE